MKVFVIESIETLVLGWICSVGIVWTILALVPYSEIYAVPLSFTLGIGCTLLWLNLIKWLRDRNILR